jgi:hypothetical protein
VVTAWLISRAVVAYLLLVVAPASPVPLNGRPVLPSWDVFLYLDGPFYASIGAHGYEYAPDGRDHSVAFFPLYPLLVLGIERLTSLPFDVVAVVFSHLVFLAALLVIYAWTEERHGASVARWTILTLCCVPLTIFGSLAYTEGLFLLLSSLSLRAYERQRFVLAGIWGGLASATHFTGVALVPAFLIGAAFSRKLAGVVAAIIASAGIGAFALFCWREFGDPLAFVHVQVAWRGGLALQLWPWQHILAVFFGVAGPRLWPEQMAVAIVGIVWWRFRERVPAVIAFALGAAVAVVELHVWFETPTMMLLVIVAGAATAVFARRIGIVATCYAAAGLAIILLAGFPMSADRIAYSIAPLIVALGLLWNAVPGAGVAMLFGFATLLPDDGIRIAQRMWWVR